MINTSKENEATGMSITWSKKCYLLLLLNLTKNIFINTICRIHI